MATKTLTLSVPEVRTADCALSCQACHAPIESGETYALFPAFAPGKPSIMVPVCKNHGWYAQLAATDLTPPSDEA